MHNHCQKRMILFLLLLFLPAALFRQVAAQVDFSKSYYSYYNLKGEQDFIICEPGAVQGSGSNAYFECKRDDETYILYSDINHSLRKFTPDSAEYSVLGTRWEKYTPINEPSDAIPYDSTASPQPGFEETQSMLALPTLTVENAGVISEITPYPSETPIPPPTQTSPIQAVREQKKTPVLLWVAAVIIIALIAALFYFNRHIFLNNGGKKVVPSDDEPDTISIGSDQTIHYTFGNMQNQGARDYQEDSFCFSDTADTALVARKGFIAVLADGMGGLKKGKEASQMAVSMFREAYTELNTAGDIPSQLRDTVMQINQAIFKTYQEDSGTTLIAMHFYKDCIHWISVGDSIVWLFRNDRLYQLNREHNHLNDMRLKYLYLEITKAQLQNEPKLRALTSNLGRRDLQLVDQNLIPFQLKVGDRILLCSDGVSGRLSETEITLAMKQADAQKCCSMLGQMIQQKNHQRQDNYTAQIICCD